jgi:mRNA interferase RelE/StbE
MSFKAFFSPKSRKTIKSFDSELKERIKKAILELINDPWEKGTIKVKGYSDVRRKRIGDYRIIYRIDEQRQEILIAIVARRDEETYKL